MRDVAAGHRWEDVTVTPSPTLRITAGVSLPNATDSVFMLTWPFLRFDMNDEVIALKYRYRWVKRLVPLAYFGLVSSTETAIWQCRIDEIANVRLSPRSALITSEHGDCCIGVPFFVPGSVRNLSRVQARLKALGVPLVYVSGNFSAMRSMKGP
jgi:hypothetical protein